MSKSSSSGFVGGSFGGAGAASGSGVRGMSSVAGKGGCFAAFLPLSFADPFSIEAKPFGFFFGTAGFRRRRGR